MRKSREAFLCSPYDPQEAPEDAYRQKWSAQASWTAAFGHLRRSWCTLRYLLDHRFHEGHRPFHLWQFLLPQCIILHREDILPCSVFLSEELSSFFLFFAPPSQLVGVGGLAPFGASPPEMDGMSFFLGATIRWFC